jgi:lipoyl(octanoyl) transferase
VTAETGTADAGLLEAPAGALSYRVVGLGPELVPYAEAWDLQRATHDRVVTTGSPGEILLLEHPPTYTAGKRTRPADRPTDGTPVVDVDRGGQITWHGPGQLVGYPILRLAEPVDVVEHVRRLEDVLMEVCAGYGLETMRVDGRTGVWVPADSPLQGTRPERKIAAIGVRVSRGVTMHGFALNCDCDLTWFDRIVPCGITDAGVTSLTAELGRTITVQDALAPVLAALQNEYGDLAEQQPHAIAGRLS